VAKVERLLALCDELKVRQTAAHEHRTRLVRSASTPYHRPDESEFRQHAAFVLQHSDLVLDSVSALRRSILSLAIQADWDANKRREVAATIAKFVHNLNRSSHQRIGDGRIW